MARRSAPRPVASALVADVWRHLRNRDQRPRPTGTARLRIVNSEDGAPTRIDLFDEIGFWGVTAQDFVDELLAIDAATIELHVNSPGGDVFDGIAIMNALADHPATVNVVVDGIAASAASFIAMAGDSVKMNRGSQLMIHDALGFCVGNAADMDEMSALLSRISDTIAGLYSDRAGGKVEDWRDLMRAETWYSAVEAVDAGLADEAVSGPKSADESAEEEPDEGEEDPDGGDEEPPAEEGESEGDEPAEEDDEEDPEAVADRFRLAVASFKYAGRAQAPAPKTPAAVAVDITKLQAALEGAF